MGFGLILIIIVSVVLLYDGGAVLKRLLGSTDGSRSYKHTESHKILDERLAKGEIDLEEYQEIRSQLENREVKL
jgi:uncharacterized membrane protein